MTLHPREELIVSGGYTESEGNAHVVMTETQPDGSKVKVSHETPHFFSNHDEGDSLIWLHATRCRLSTPIGLKSAGTEIPHIGMPLLKKYPKKYFVLQLSETASQSEYLDLNNLMATMSRNVNLAHILCLELQVLYVVSGCDYVSYFDHYSKNTFLNVFLDNIIFISFKEDYCGSLSQTSIEDWDDGLLAFYHLIACVFFTKCPGSFRVLLGCTNNPSHEQVYQFLKETNSGMCESDLTSMWLEKIRQMVRKEPGCETEDYWLPSDDALKLHWKRCYILQMWKQADQNTITLPDITEWGWSVVENELVVKWDSQSNLKRIDKYRKLWINGCKCKSLNKPCSNRNCGCQKNLKSCGPACKCSNKCCNKPVDPSIEALMQDESGTSSERPEGNLEVVLEECVTDEEFDCFSDSDDIDNGSDDEIPVLSD